LIIFDRVTYRNFLASGDVPITLELHAHASTLIIGANGAGKSTMTEAICFALFGRALRNINKPALVNSTNKRDTMVELWLTIDQTQYQIRRGIKPTLFEIYVDGVVVPAPASLADYQTLLETTILKINYKSFMQIVVLGSASFVPFMRLTPAARREIIEDLLDIEIFSAMSGLTKDELTETKTAGDQLTLQRVLLDEQIRMAHTFTTQLTDERESKLAIIQSATETTETQIASLRAQQTTLTEQLLAYASAPAAYQVASQKLSEYTTTYRAIGTREKKLEKERLFYTTHDECPTCEQSITDTFKHARFHLLSEKDAAAQIALTQCQVLIDKYQTLTNARHDRLDEADAIRAEYNLVDVQVPIHTRRLRELAEERDTVLAPPPAPVDIEALQTRQQDIHAQHVVVSTRRSVLETALTLLKDSGIKSRVIKHYLPIINKQINYYLTAMDFPIHFTLDEEFKESIQSRHRDEFSYESFSEGEKKRIDLALLLTWRAIARLKNSAACNVLVLDEVFDSSLDVNGTEEFLKIIHTLEHANVFVISHKTDTLVDRFTHTIQFVKQRGFSAIKV
jgi:DNA repair exonuclease SbcCD ATPase subunit